MGPHTAAHPGREPEHLTDADLQYLAGLVLGFLDCHPPPEPAARPPPPASLGPPPEAAAAALTTKEQQRLRRQFRVAVYRSKRVAGWRSSRYKLRQWNATMRPRYKGRFVKNCGPGSQLPPSLLVPSPPKTCRTTYFRRKETAAKALQL